MAHAFENGTTARPVIALLSDANYTPDRNSVTAINDK